MPLCPDGITNSPCALCSQANLVRQQSDLLQQLQDVQQRQLQLQAQLQAQLSGQQP